MFIENNEERFILSRWAYLMGEPIISDVEYDRLERWYREQYPNSPYSTRPWSFDECPKELLKKYNREDWDIQLVMGYQAESISSLNTEYDVRRNFSSMSGRHRVSFKIDGWNTRASYYNGNLVKFETRGRSGNNLDITSLYKVVPAKIPLKGRVAVTGETSIPNSKWPLYKQITGNTDQRASVRTAIARGDIDYLSFLAFNIFVEDDRDAVRSVFDMYPLLRSLGFKTPLCREVNSYQTLMKCIDYMSSLSKTYGYLTDGLVIENEGLQLAIRIGAWKEEINCSYVTEYIENQGMYGVSFNVGIRPVPIGGKSFSQVSVVNLAQIQENKLAIGAPIAFNLRSSANVVLDAENTYKLQKEWAGRYDEYKDYIDNKYE